MNILIAKAFNEISLYRSAIIHYLQQLQILSKLNMLLSSSTYHRFSVHYIVECCNYLLADRIFMGPAT
ncbi:Uroporphyrinogen decarboxylase [Dirofilaria immitis]